MASSRRKLLLALKSRVLRPFYRTHRLRLADSDIAFPLADPYVYKWFIRYSFRKYNWHEPSLTQFVLDLAPDKTVLVDVGAHLGYFSILFARHAANTSYAIELDPVNFTHLERMADGAQGIKGTVIPVNTGLSDSAFCVDMPVAAASPFTSLQQQTGAAGDTRPVPVTTLDAFCAERRITPDVVKVDVEGYEWEFLKGAATVLKRARPILIIEVHKPQLEEKGVSVDDLITSLTDLGYDIRWFTKHRGKTPGRLEPFSGAGTRRNFDIVCMPAP